MPVATKSKPKTRKSRRESSNRANKRRRMEDSTVFIPSLTAAQKRRRKRLEADNEAWIWEMCGPKSGIEVPLARKFSSQQCEMIAAYDETLRFGGDEMILASRGEGKTTYFRAMVWKSVVSGLASFVALIGATGDDAGNSREAIQSMITTSIPFRQLYPEVAIPCMAVGATPQLAKSMLASGSQFDDGRKKFSQHPISFLWSKDGLDMPRVPGSPCSGFKMRFRGADSPIRGLNIRGQRPVIVAMDDLDTPDTVNNFEVAQKVIRRVQNDIGGLGTPTDPMSRIMLATLPEEGCGVAHHFAMQGHPFVIKRFKFLVEKPANWDMWMKYVSLRRQGKVKGDKYGREAHHFYLANFEDMNAGHKVSNPQRFVDAGLPDGSQTEVSALQHYFNAWADKGEMFCRCEFDNEIIQVEERIESKLDIGHVTNCEGEIPHKQVDPTTMMITRGIDVRKTELHWSVLSMDDFRRHRVPDYNVRTHGSNETTVEQAEYLILKALHELADEWDRERFMDYNGGEHSCDLTLVDKGWKGNWKEDGEWKSWASQPVETFCMERGLRRWLPAKGAPNYRSPAPSESCIVGDNWHMNIGVGAERQCTEVIWNATHWHSLVEQLFMQSRDNIQERFELFVAPGDSTSPLVNHKRLGEHIREGAHDLAELKRSATANRKQRYRRDHWWDSFAEMLVARSIETWIRESDQTDQVETSALPPQENQPQTYQRSRSW